MLDLTATICTFILVFVTFWWIIFLMALPIGVTTPPTIEKGHASSAPQKPHLKRKIIGTTIVTCILTTIFMYYRELGYMDLYYWFRK